MIPLKRPKASMQQVSLTTSIQAPTGGLNAKDALAAMKETEAVIMENWFPTPSSVDIRNGNDLIATVSPASPVETLMAYQGGTDGELLAISGSRIFSSADTYASAVLTGLSNARFQYINFGTVGGRFLLAVNGADKLIRYDGTTWTQDGDGSNDITGIDTATCIGINNFKNRVWLIEKNSMNAWYLGVASIGGAASKLDLGSLFKLGGYLMAMANWTIDNSSGVDDYAAFITSEGEVAIYQGTDPSDATKWALRGTFRMGKPIGRRCASKAGADVLVLTTDGAFPLSKALLTDRSQVSLAATDKISNLISADIRSYVDNYGWQAVIHPPGRKLIINVPQVEDTTFHQYVMNTTHGAWTKFSGWNGICFETFDDELYYGDGDGNIYKADTGQSDNGENINTACQQAYSYFGDRGRQKRWSMCRPVFISDGVINPAVMLNVDYAQNQATSSGSFTENPGSAWDTSTWDVSGWNNGDNIIKRWQSITGVGFAGGLRIQTMSSNLSCKWLSTDFVYEVGGVL